jgi:hypothetical protein
MAGKRNRNRIIDADKLLKKSGFKSPNDEVAVMQDEIRQGEEMSRIKWRVRIFK